MADLGTKFSGESRLSALIDSAWAGKSASEPPREYLGASIIGHPCVRYLWLAFRWASLEWLNGRQERLLETGKREEDIAVENLKKAGVEIINTGKDQLDLDFGCHVKGHPDGIILSGVPEASQTKHVWEHKTMSDSNFKNLKKNGVKEAKPLHYAQMQVEMLALDIDRALYQVLNKNDSEIYTERVRLDRDFAENLIRRAQEIVLQDRIPKRLSDKEDWYECRMCKNWGFCFTEMKTPRANCRTCAHFYAEKDDTCRCNLYDNAVLPYEGQRKGCINHVMHPDLTDWILDDDKSTEYAACYYIKELNREVMNGYDGFSTASLIGEINDQAQRLSESNTDIAF